MDMCMHGVGVSFDLLGADQIKIQSPKIDEQTYVIDDTREGWCNAVGTVIGSYFGEYKLPMEFDYSKIRPNGAPIKTFGGIAPGPDPLIDCIETLKSFFNMRIDKFLSSVDIVDIMNILGKTVVSGGVRRSAELALGSATDNNFLSMKDPVLYPEELKHHRWASNDSILSCVGTDYTNLSKQTAKNGEPGYVFLDNMKKYGRLKDGPNYTDELVKGCNPCAEMSLCDGEICCLVETFPSLHENKEDFHKTLKFAYLYAKTITLVPTHSEKTNQVMLRNRRIGISMSGIVDAINRHGYRNIMSGFCDSGYEYIKSLDKIYSNWLCVPRSIKISTVKPSGSVSLLPGVSPGIHFPHSKFYIRRIEFQKNSPFIPSLEKAGYKKIQSVYKKNSWIFEFPVKSENFVKSKNDVTIWEQMALHADIQYYWSDNNVSQTVTFRKEEAHSLKDVLESYEDKIKAISFLPLSDHQYEQAPYEEITEEEYTRRKSEIISEIDFSDVIMSREEDAVSKEANKYCDGESCTL
jgi:adenosylcobalamin-dependent ribonucleoside-triphosphate reductase